MISFLHVFDQNCIPEIDFSPPSYIACTLNRILIHLAILTQCDECDVLRYSRSLDQCPLLPLSQVSAWFSLRELLDPLLKSAVENSGKRRPCTRSSFLNWGPLWYCSEVTRKARKTGRNRIFLLLDRPDLNTWPPIKTLITASNFRKLINWIVTS